MQTDKPTQKQKDFVSKLGHEILTPIVGIRGFLELVDRNKLPISDANWIELIDKSSETLHKMVLGILEENRTGKGDLGRDPFNVLDSTVEVIELLKIHQRFKSKDLDLCLYFNENANFNFLGDKFRFKQIVTNILNNAIKFTEEGFINVYIDFSETESDEKDLHLKIVDTGIGMSKDKLGTIFQTGTRVASEEVRHEVEGYGLGLSIVDDIIKMMKGRIEVASILNEGTTFDIYLPLEMTDACHLKPQKSDDDKKKGEYDDIKVLVAEHNSATQKFISSMLSSYSVDHHFVGSGEEFVEASKNEKYDLMFIDINIPGENALATAKKIKEVTPTQLVYALTTEVRHVLDNEINNVVDGFIVKPIKTRYLLEILKQSKYKKL